MILACPACATRYRVLEGEFEGSAVRTVRCANCGHAWRATSVAAQNSGAAAPAEAAASPAAEPVREVSRQIPRIEAPVRPPSEALRKKRRGWAALSWVVAIVVLLLVVAVAGMLVRRQLAAVWPSAARLYALAGHPATAPASGLVIRNIKPARTAEGLRIDGEIADTGTQPRDVPRLRVVLQNAAEKEVQSEIVDPPKSRLEPGETVAFQTSFSHPPDAATGVVVTFAAP
jgi:predicted Zn finger-like uncharacterized protein